MALFVFRTSVGNDIFKYLSTFVKGFLSKAYYGTEFVFGTDVANANVFAVSVFPTLIFFSAVVQILYYIGALQWFLAKSSVIFTALLNISGAESVVAVASVNSISFFKKNNQWFYILTFLLTFLLLFY